MRHYLLLNYKFFSTGSKISTEALLGEVNHISDTCAIASKIEFRRSDSHKLALRENTNIADLVKIQFHLHERVRQVYVVLQPSLTDRRESLNSSCSTASKAELSRS